MNIQHAVQRLSEQLPLLQQQQKLSEELRRLHRSVLKAFINQGRPLSNAEVMQQLHDYSLNEALEILANADLVVLDKDKNNIVGAYPMTMEKTEHVIRVAGHSFYAMCALDALSIAPMFNQEVSIISRCAMTRQPIKIHMTGHKLLSVTPNENIRIGILWQQPDGVAAHSMCMEMVFLLDAQQAGHWLAHKNADISIFTLEQAIEFGANYFTPLLVENAE